MGKFNYFAYGSNLLKQRLELSNYSHVKLGTIAKLDHYKLDFGWISNTWNGAVATIVPSRDNHVWGAVWLLDTKDLSVLDNQESVSKGMYEPFEVDVVTPDGERIRCRTYRLLKEKLEDHRPSRSYLKVILKGAQQLNLPQEYIDKLKLIEDNGVNANARVMKKLL